MNDFLLFGIWIVGIVCATIVILSAIFAWKEVKK